MMKTMKNIMNTMETTVSKIQKGRFKYYLNDEATLTKLKKAAKNMTMEEIPTKDLTHSLQFSTGA